MLNFFVVLGIIFDTMSINTIKMDGSSVQSIVIPPRNGNNFVSWSRAVKVLLRGKTKLGWISGRYPKPDDKDPNKIEEWETEKYIVLDWLFGSMEPNIYELFMFYNTVDGLWAALTEMYAHSRNSTRILKLFQEIAQASQKNDYVKVYYGYLKKRWEELKHHESLAYIKRMSP